MRPSTTEKSGVVKPRPPALDLPVQSRPRFRNLLQQLRDGALHGARVPEVNPHPIGGCELPGIRATRRRTNGFGSNLVRRRFVLRLPAQRVVIASVTEVQEASSRHQEIQRGVELLAHGSPQGTGVRPVLQLVHRRNQRQPAGHVAVAQPTRRFFQIRLQVIERHPVLCVPLARDLGQPLQQRLGFAHDELGNDLVMQPPEQIVIARQIAAVKK